MSLPSGTTNSGQNFLQTFDNAKNHREETTPLIPQQPEVALSHRLTKPVSLLLLMKLFGTGLSYQIMNFNIDAYTADPNNTEACLPVPYKPQGNAYTGSTAMLLAAASTFLLPTLGGLISDRHFGCVKVLTFGCMVQFWVSIMQALLIKLCVMCHNHIWFLVMVGGLTIEMGLVDPLLLYGLMQNVNGSHSRTFLVFAYYVVAACSECFGSLPSLLRYLLRESAVTDSFEFLGIVFSASLVICTFLLSSDNRACDKLRNENFELPRFFRLRRYYIIVAGFIPFITVIVLCRNIFYWKEIKYYTNDEDGFISTAIPMTGYLAATIGFCLIGAVATAMGKFPQCLTIGVRIRSGLFLMITSKVILFIISFTHTRMSELGQSHPVAIQGIYFAAAFTDGAANALAGAGMYQLVDCIAERCAKAMYIGIFFTTWGLGLMLTGIVVIVLRQLPSEGEEMIPKSGAQPQFYIRYAISTFLLFLSLAYYTKVALPLAEPLILTRLEADEEEPRGEIEMVL